MGLACDSLRQAARGRVRGGINPRRRDLSEGEGEGEGWSGECGRSVPSRQIVKPARRRRTRVAEENVQGACPYVHVRVCAE